MQVRLDRTTTLEVTLALAKFADEVQVIAETPVVDRTQVSARQIPSDYMQQIRDRLGQPHLPGGDQPDGRRGR